MRQWSKPGGDSVAAYSGKTHKDSPVSVQDYFASIELSSFVSPMRSNGLNSMVERVQAIAREYESEHDAFRPRRYLRDQHHPPHCRRSFRLSNHGSRFDEGSRSSTSIVRPRLSARNASSTPIAMCMNVL